MIQDIGPRKYVIGYENKTEVTLDSYVLLYQKRQVLCGEDDGELVFPTVRECLAYGLFQNEYEIENQGREFEKLHLELTREVVSSQFEQCRDSFLYLFSIDGEAFFTNLNWYGGTMEQYILRDIEIFRTVEPKWLSFAGVTGFQLSSWYKSKKFCSVCGTPLEHSKTERAMVCPKCHKTEYPVICPSVIVAVTDNDRLLLTKYASNHSSYIHYALNAGYVEVGETLEDTVRREIMEEVGLTVKNITYYKSQPWSFSGALLSGFYCEVDGDTTVSMDTMELSEAAWFHRDEIEPKNPSISLTNEMIEQFRTRKIGFVNGQLKKLDPDQ